MRRRRNFPLKNVSSEFLIVKCLTHTRHDRASELKLLRISAGIIRGFRRYTHTGTHAPL